MTREERVEELNRLRRSNPARLIGIYRAATNTPLLANLPRGLGFTGMIAAILDSEFRPETMHAESQASTYVSLDALVPESRVPETSPELVPEQSPESVPEPSPALLEPPTPVRRWDHVAEFRAFSSGAAIVLTGLAMAAVYFILARHISV
jgi:hypothetical protein